MNIIDCASSKEHMEYYENRLRTFDTYPKQMLPDKIQLARAGLYYTGKSDVCQCFLCHVKLNAWEREDDAIKEHYKMVASMRIHQNDGSATKKQDSHSDQVHHLLESLEQGLVSL